jgi:hypothetical protein
MPFTHAIVISTTLTGSIRDQRITTGMPGGALNRFIKQGMNGCGSVIKGIDVDCGVDS